MPVPRITKEQLKEKLDSGDAGTAPVILDVRLKYPYEHSTVKLPGAVRMLPDDVQFDRIPTGRELVAYDSDPEELVSARVVAALIRRGSRASALKGGIAEWIAAGFPTVARTSAPPEPAKG